jgi:hypothetical protein
VADYHRDFQRVDCDGFYRIENYDERTRGSPRWISLIEVLRRIPPDGYERLLRQAGKFFLFIPHDYCLGMVMPFQVNYTPPVGGPGRRAGGLLGPCPRRRA